MKASVRVVLKFSRVGADFCSYVRQFHWAIVRGKKENFR